MRNVRVATNPREGTVTSLHFVQCLCYKWVTPKGHLKFLLVLLCDVIIATQMYPCWISFQNNGFIQTGDSLIIFTDSLVTSMIKDVDPV